ncbi:MAG: CapA family protein [Thermoleophilia bacterium]|nr:CapA family protein [Thermoleophilia bacterium]
MHERRAARRRAVVRRRVAALALVALALAGLVVGVLGATGGDAPDSSPGGAPPAGSEAETGATGPATETSSPAADAPPDVRVRIAAVGDIVMGTTGNLPPDGGEGFFAGVASALVGDVVLGNLEGTLSTGPGSKCGPDSTNCFAFQTPPGYASWLDRAGFTVLNLANNHSFDFGAEGQRQTVAALRRHGLRATGRPGQIAIQRVGAARVAILGFAPYPWAQDLTDLPAAAELVRKASREADLVVVTFHGGAEGADRTHVPPGPETYLGEARGDLRAFAHAVVDAGADLVIGHGPHVLRGMEWYGGRLVAYSLGNFGGYGVFSLAGPLAVSGVLQVTLEADGSWVEGHLVATVLAGEGIPALDPAEAAHGIVRELSKADFGARAMRVTKTGALRPPG